MNKVSRFKAVFFDAGGTLLTPHPSVGEIYSNVAAKHGCSVDGSLIEFKFKEAWLKKDRVSGHSGLSHEKQWWYDLVQDVFSSVVTFENYEAFFDELYDVFARPEYWRLYSEVHEVLLSLKEQGFKMGIVSNWDHRLIPLCQKMDLERHFDFILASGIVGSSKPDSGIFYEALKRAKVDAKEAVHVGDSLKDDVHGPQRVGIQAVLLDRSGSKHYPIPTIHTLADLYRLLLDI